MNLIWQALLDWSFFLIMLFRGQESCERAISISKSMHKEGWEPPKITLLMVDVVRYTLTIGALLAACIDTVILLSLYFR